MLRLDFQDDHAILRTVLGEFGLDASGGTSAQAELQKIGIVGEPEVGYDLEGNDLWPELLYDLGANIGLLERYDHGLEYRSVEHADAHATVALTCRRRTFEFVVALDQVAIGLPDTFHNWARRHPEGFSEPVRL